VNVEGLGSLAAEPDPPPRNSGGMKPSTVAGSGPNTRNPAGGADGVGVGSGGGSLPKLAIGQRRWGALLAQLAINHLVAQPDQCDGGGGPRTAATRMPGRSTSAALPSAEPAGTR